MLSNMAKSDLVSPAGRESAQQTLELSQEIRAQRDRFQAGGMPSLKQASVAGPPYSTFRSIWSIQNTTNLGAPIWLRDANYEDADAQDWVVDKVWEYLGVGVTMYGWDFGRNGIDNAGSEVRANIHYGQSYANAFWNGSQLVFGDGNEVLAHLGESICVVVHELTHAVTQHTAGLIYQGQSGALNESFSDVMGCVAEQQSRNQNFDHATWLVGEECLLPGVNGVAIRSMSAPGTAYNDPRLGKDPQPSHMNGYVNTTQDSGGVHINSGIPNHAFYQACRRTGGNSWDQIAGVWFWTMVSGQVKPDCDFYTFASLTVQSAIRGWGNLVAHSVVQAWNDVGITVQMPASPTEDEKTVFGDVKAPSTTATMM